MLSREWMYMLLKHMCDEDWVTKNKKKIAETLPAYIVVSQWADPAITIVNAIAPVLIDIHDYKMACDLLESALNSPYMEKNSDLEFELEQHLASAELQRGHLDRAEKLLDKNLKRIDESKPSVELLRTYLDIVRLRVYRHEFSFDEKQLNSIVRMGVKFHYPMGNIYATVALAYFSQGMKAKMAEYITKANKAYALELYSKPESRMVGIAQMYFRDAITKRVTNNVDDAERALSHAADLFAETDYHMQYVSVLYETSQLYVCKGEYQAAEEWINLAIAEQSKHYDPNPYYDAMLHHGKGLVLYYLDDFAGAIEHFYVASTGWEAMHDTYNYALSLNALGSAQIRLEHPLDAINCLNEARKLCEAHTDVEHVSELLKTIQTNMNDANDLLNR